MTPLAYHILARLDATGEASPRGVDRKAKFGKYVTKAPDFARSHDLPDMVIERLPEVVRREFALSPPRTPDDSDPISTREYRAFWQDQLTNRPWTIYGIAEDMAARFDINPGWAFKTTRQHLNQLVLQARMRAYRDEEPLAGRRFRWSGPEPDHPACEWLRDQVPEEGLPYHELVELMGEAKHRFVEDPPSSSHVVHDWCRHQITEVQ